MQRSTRRLFLRAASTVLAPLGLPLPGSAAPAEKYTMRLNVIGTADAVNGLSSLHFAQGVGSRSNGQLTVEVYPNLQLASERDSVQALVSGVIDFTVQTTSQLVQFAPRFGVFDLPFLFRNATASYKVLDGSIGTDLFADLVPKGILGLGWLASDFKQYETVSKSITVPEDMKGLRMRTQSTPIYVAMYQALGAIPVTIDFSEALPALAAHTVDGLDISLDAFSTGKWYSAAKHVALSNHIPPLLPILGSKRRIDALPANLQKIVYEEGRNVAPYARSISARNRDTAIANLKKNGVTFTDTQYPAFRKAVEPVYTTFGPRLGVEFVDRVVKAANS